MNTRLCRIEDRVCELLSDFFQKNFIAWLERNEKRADFMDV